MIGCRDSRRAIYFDDDFMHWGNVPSDLAASKEQCENQGLKYEL
jgi:hypothetical protein